MKAWAHPAASVLSIGGYDEAVRLSLLRWRHEIEQVARSQGIQPRIPSEVDELLGALSDMSRQPAPQRARTPDTQISAYVDYSEAADLLGIHRRTLERRVADGIVPHVREGRRVRFDVVDLADYLARHRVA